MTSKKQSNSKEVMLTQLFYADSVVRDQLFLEVLLDIRDILASLPKQTKLKKTK